MPIFPKQTKLSLALRSGASCLGLLALASAPAMAADEMEFNASFLHRTGGGGADLSYFQKGNAIAPGNYGVDVYLNLALVKRHDIAFVAGADGQVQPVVSYGLLKELGVDLLRLEREGLIPAGSDDAAPIDLAERIPSATVRFDLNNLALMISVPQAYVQRQTRGYVDPSLWDDGLNAFHVNYQANFNRNTRQGVDSNYGHVNLRSGLNIGGWRLRNNASFSRTNGQSGHFRSDSTYVERDIRALGAKLAIGDLYTPGDIFGGVRFRGAQLGTDLGMLPDNAQGYAPVVRGIAETNATVEIQQNGVVIYSTPVPPGAFEIRDLYPNGSNGDLTIRILEADGRVRESTQAYAYLPVMIRPGSLRYHVAAGEYRGNGADRATPGFAQGTLVYGLSDNLTAYGGALASEDYHAVNLGVGVNSALGGMSLDITRSESRPDNGPAHTGYSARFLYAKTLAGTNTSLTMAGYRYSTEGFRTFSEHVSALDHPTGEATAGRQKNRLDLNVNQWLADKGSLYLSLGETSYWNLPGRTRNWQFGYSGTIGRVSYRLAYARVRNGTTRDSDDTQINASFSIPLGRDRSRSHSLYANTVSSRHGGDNVQAGVSGYLNDSGTLDYSLQASHTEGVGTSTGGRLGWETPKARLGASYNRDPDARQASLSAAGSLVVHRGGLTLGQPVGETFGLVEVPRTRGVGVQGWNGVRTNRRGHAVVPYLQPYRMNWVNLDTPTLDADIEIAASAMRLVPTRGAVVKARYEASQGRRVQFELRQPDGQPIPMGAMVHDADGAPLGMVDSLSRVLLFGIAEQGRLDVRWSDARCGIDYTLPAANPELAYERVPLICTPVAANAQEAAL